MDHCMKKIFTLLLLLFATGALLAQLTSDPKSLDSALRQLYQSARFNGTVLYAERGKVIYHKAFGVTDCRNNSPLGTSSSFNLASVTKQFVSMCIMILQQEGKLQLEDELQKYFPEMPYEGVTVRNLLTHTSGIPEYFDIFLQYRTPLDTLTNQKMIALFSKVRPAAEFAPGTSWKYCNTNYVLLVSIIERVSGQPIEVFINKRISIPLGLMQTYVYQVMMNNVPANHVYGFEETGEKRKLNDLTVFDGVVGDGNLYSSVEDLYRWEQSLSTEKLVKKEILQEAFRPVKLKNGKTYPYGFGWVIESEKEQRYDHTGGWAGFRNLIYRDVKNGRTLIILSSGNNSEALRVAKSFMEGQPLNILPTFLISNVQLIDGTGSTARKAAVRVEGNKIIAVGRLEPFAGEENIDGQGNLLTPGFIDSHSHLQGYLTRYPQALAALNQGVTTIVSGQDGGSEPVDSIKASLLRVPAAINVATYTGHTSIREKVMGLGQLDRPATEEQLEKMKELLREDLQKGSLGLSTGLEYEGAFYSSRIEVLELAKVAAAEKGRYISHIRSEDVNLEDAIDEIISIGREAKLPVQISHIKIALKDSWGKAPSVLAELQRARAEGIDITSDCYPYVFWNSTLRVLFPSKDFKSLSAATFATEHLFDPEASILIHFAPDTSYAGKTISQIAILRHQTTAQTLLYLVAAAEDFSKQHPEAGNVETIMSKSMDEQDLIDFLKWPHTNLCSDGANGGHPRGYGSFTRFLSVYVRQKKIMSWEEAINKMTALTAEHCGIKQRGVVAPGYFADLVLLDPQRVQDRSIVGDSRALSDGIVKVWVNGTLVYKDKVSQQKFPGMFVSK